LNESAVFCALTTGVDATVASLKADLADMALIDLDPLEPDIARRAATGLAVGKGNPAHSQESPQVWAQDWPVRPQR
jgi:hypothetical protein